MCITHNQRGDSTLLSLVFILICATLAIGFYSFRIEHFKNQKAKQKLLLCNKVYKGETYKNIKRIESLNVAIAMLNGAKAVSTVASLVVPGFGAIARKSFGATVKAIKVIQQGVYLSHQAKIFKLTKICTLSPTILIGPYKTKKIKLRLKRDIIGRAILRKKKWSAQLKNGPYIINNKIRYKGLKVRIKSKVYSTKILASLF